MLESIGLFALISGITAGIAHTLSGPDHLAAIAPLTSRSGSWKTGLYWSTGHTAAVAIISVLLFVFREALPLEQFSAWNEQAVGVLLIVLGVWSLYRIYAQTDIAVHQHPPGAAPLGIGLVHGFAGSAHIIGVLPGLAFAAISSSILYLTGFALGSIAAMSGFSWTISKVAYHKTASPRQMRFARAGFATLSIFAGVFWLSITG